MPWKETCVMEQRVKFVMDALDGTYDMTELCRSYPKTLVFGILSAINSIF